MRASRAPVAALLNERLTAATLLTGLIAVWLATHPYRGIYHDARLYALQALQVLHPDLYSNDLFFRFGSQESFTLFSRVYALLISMADLETATRALVVAGLLFWVGALYLVARSVSDGWERWLFLLLAASWPAGYGDFTFSYAESFVSARLFAEVFVLAGLVAMLGRRWVLAGAAAVGAALLHPLVCLSGLILSLCYLGLKDRRWWLTILAGGLSALLLGLTGLPPFQGLWQQMDSEWFQLAYLRNRAVFISQWNFGQLTLIVWNVGVLALAATVARGRTRRLIQALVCATALGLTANLVGSDLLANTFLIQVQLFRILWLTQLFSYLALAILLLDRTGSSLLSRSWLAASALVAPGSNLALLGGFALLRRPGLGARLPRMVRRLLWLPFPAALFFWSGSWIAGTQLMIARREAVALLGAPVSGYGLQAILGALILLGCILVAFLHLRSKKVPRRVSAALMGLLLAASIGCWDQRDPVQRRVEDSYATRAAVLPPLPDGASVFWDDFHVNEVWLAARRPIYVSWLQGAGLLFSRGTAIEWRRRIERVSGEPFFDADGERQGEALPATGTARLAMLCQDPSLDYVVLRSDRAGHSTRFELGGRPFYLYDCDSLLQASLSERSMTDAH